MGKMKGEEGRNKKRIDQEAKIGRKDGLAEERYFGNKN